MGKPKFKEFSKVIYKKEPGRIFWISNIRYIEINNNFLYQLVGPTMFDVWSAYEEDIRLPTKAEKVLYGYG